MRIASSIRAYFQITLLIASALQSIAIDVDQSFLLNKRQTSSGGDFDGANLVPLYRAFDGQDTDHFYTANRSELVASIGRYVSEGITCLIFPTQAPNSVPLYRAYQPAAIDHFYTTNLTEKNNAVSQLGYADEGTTGYIFTTAVSGSIPLFRMYSAVGTDHFYTTNATEKDNAIHLDAYTDEGIAGYVFPTSLISSSSAPSPSPPASSQPPTISIASNASPISPASSSSSPSSNSPAPASNTFPTDPLNALPTQTLPASSWRLRPGHTTTSALALLFLGIIFDMLR